MSKENSGAECVSPNADDHLTRTSEPAIPETQVERSGASSCSFSAFWPEFIENLGQLLNDGFWAFTGDWEQGDMRRRSEVADVMVRSLPEKSPQTDILQALQDSLVLYDKDLKRTLEIPKD